MKKMLSMLFLVSVVLFSGCSEDNNGINENEIPKENKAPVIESIDLGKVEFGINQIIIVRAKVTDPENDNISLSWSSGSKDFGKGQELELTLASKGDKAAVDCVQVSSLSKKITVIDCDFGFGVWNDDIDVIKRREKGTYIGTVINAENTHRFIDNGNWYYKFSNNKLSSGIYEMEYTPQVMQSAQFKIAWTLYEETLNNLIEKFGNHTNQEINGTFIGDSEKDGLAILNGARITTYFSNERTTVTFKVFRKNATSNTVMYETTYISK